jgi:hypothetical protein
MGKCSFKQAVGVTILEVGRVFNAYCVNLARQINTYESTKTVLIIALGKVKLNGIFVFINNSLIYIHKHVCKQKFFKDW